MVQSKTNHLQVKPFDRHRVKEVMKAEKNCLKLIIMHYIVDVLYRTHASVLCVILTAL